jgi:hypothetical protein
MRRRKRYTILRIALGLAVSGIVPVTAQAKLTPYNHDLQANPQAKATSHKHDLQAHGQYQLGPGEIPYLSQVGVPSAKRGFAVVKSPDDRSFSRVTTVDTEAVVSDDGRSIEINAYTVTGFALALLLAIGGGMGIAVWHSRTTRLAPA